MQGYRDKKIYQLGVKISKLNKLLKKYNRHDMLEEFLDAERELEIQMSYKEHEDSQADQVE